MGGGNIVARPEKGMLNKDIPEPSFLADPNHRCKTLGKDLYNLKKKPKTPPEVKDAKDARAAAHLRSVLLSLVIMESTI